jgi:hypothetical protein
MVLLSRFGKGSKAPYAVVGSDEALGDKNGAQNEIGDKNLAITKKTPTPGRLGRAELESTTRPLEAVNTGIAPRNICSCYAGVRPPGDLGLR